VISSSYDPLIVGLRNGVKSDQAIGASAAEIAQGFESLLVRQFLAAARSASLLSEEPSSESGWREMGDDALAGFVTKQGGFGLTKQITSLLEQAQVSNRSGIVAGLDSKVTRVNSAGALNGKPDLAVFVELGGKFERSDQSR
jgi:Rod binding domain-containing protein